MARRRNSNRRRRRGSVGFLYKLLSTLVICGAIVAALTLFFRVDTIVVTGEKRYSEQEILDATGIQTGDNLYLMNKNDVASRMVTALPYLKNVRINRKLPDTLLIEVEECSTPLAVVQDGYAWLVSPGDKARGKLKIVDQLEAGAAADYGVIDGCALLAPSVGGQLALATEYASQQESLEKLMHALEDAGMLDQVDGIRLDDLSVLSMDYAGRFTVKMPYSADYAYKLQYLELTLADEKIQNIASGTIDLSRDDGTAHLIQNVR